MHQIRQLSHALQHNWHGYDGLWQMFRWLVALRTHAGVSNETRTRAGQARRALRTWRCR
jgi:hypothetical protein